MVTDRRGAMTDDVLSDMMRAEAEGDRLTHQELLALAATLLINLKSASANTTIVRVTEFD